MKKTKVNTADEQKAVSLPLTDEERRLVEGYLNNKESFFKYEPNITPEKTTYSMLHNFERGTDREKGVLLLAKLCQMLGVKDVSVAERLISSCHGASGLIQKGTTPESIAETLSMITKMVQELGAADAIEAMLVTQIVSLHFQTQDYLFTSSVRENSPQIREMHANRAVKLGRLQNEKIETLMRYRRKGAQQVVVQHVNVGSGGQAIVGNLQTGG